MPFVHNKALKVDRPTMGTHINEPFGFFMKCFMKTNVKKVLSDVE
jgi:hypothetical protein